MPRPAEPPKRRLEHNHVSFDQVFHTKVKGSSLWMNVGITGGLGCGKSTAAWAFEQHGFRRIDSDQIVRERVLVAPAVIAALRTRFGDSVLMRQGEEDVVNRPALAARVFSNDEDRLWLEELTHPLVFEEWNQVFSEDPDAKRVIEVPLLHEKGLENWFDFTVCVACAPAQQLVRLEQRGLPRVLAGQRISKQLPLAQKIERSDFVLWNEGSAPFLEAQVGRLAGALSAT